MDKYILKVRRGVPENQYWEEFELDLVPFANVISSLMEIQKNPINKQGQKTTPVAWEQGCLEEVCGSCSLLINGIPRQACTALIHKIIQQTGSNTITLAPMSSFPLIKDLYVDRQAMFQNLKKTRAWIDADGTHTQEFGPKVSAEKQQTMYVLSTCMTCGCCSEACPNVNAKSKFMGPAPISQVRLFNAHPTGKMSANKRNRILMEEGGIADCSNAQNCVQVCPKNIPLTESIAFMGGQVSKQAARDIFNITDNEPE
ncbi:MAG: succinate dehydrogenase iron-sulfur subunit [Chlamydiia bacterium]|nr:succinate dehydrogenase iron-sulfur subunit [Chlamydiia bacterium]MCP5509506.1 succinate dehydrogenase iron-sulfur subunit [Chlamydiales bacterium]